MSLQVIGLAAELCRNDDDASHVAVNALWPRTTIATAAIQNVLGGDDMMRRSRTTEIMADAAHVILCSDGKRNTGNFWIDDEVMVGSGAVDLSKYRVDQTIPEHDLCPDLFV